MNVLRLMKKRIMPLLIVLILVFENTVGETAMVLGNEIFSENETEEFPDLDLDVCIGLALTDEQYSLAPNAINITLTHQTPASVLVECEKNTDFQDKLTAWKTLTFEGSDLVQGEIDEIGYYEMIILSTLQESFGESGIIEHYMNDFEEGKLRLASTFENIIELGTNIEYDSIKYDKTLSESEKKKAIETLNKTLDNCFPEYDTVESILEYAQIAFDTGKTIGEVLDNSFAYIKCCQMTEHVKLFLRELYFTCDGEKNKCMKTALENIYVASQSYLGVFDGIVYDLTTKSISIVAGLAMDQMVEGIISAIPYGGAFLAAQAIGKNVANVLFSTDEMCEQYQKMEVFYNFEILLRTVLKEKINRFINNKTSENAKILMAGIDLLYKETNLSCDMAKEFAHVVYRENIFSFFGSNKEKYDAFVSEVDYIQGFHEELYNDIVEIYISTYLETMFPDLYDTIFEEKSPLYCGEEFVIDGLTYSIIDTAQLDIEIKKCVNSISGNIQLPDYVRYKGYTLKVKQIGNYAFYGCKAISKINIPSTIVYIGQGAFQECGGLITVELSENIDSIGQSVFQQCSSLVNIEIPASVTKIGSSAFSGCSSLKEMKISENVESIENSAFAYCSSLTEIDVHEENKNYTSVDGILYDKNKIELLVCPAGKSGLVNILSGVTTIKYRAFEKCEKVTFIKIPDTVITIGNYAFDSCISLQEINISSKVEYIGDYALRACGSLTDINVDSENQYYSTEEGILYNKSKTELICCPAGKQGVVDIMPTVNSIVKYAFDSCKKLTDIRLGQNIEIIDTSAFSHCESIINLKLPESLTYVEASAFSGCSSLVTIEIPKNVCYIGNNAFADCSNLLVIEVADANQYFSSELGVLYNKDKTNLLAYPNGKSEMVSIPLTINRIEWSAFSGCTKLTKIRLPEHIKTIDSFAFSGCTGLLSIEIPSSVNSIGKYAFSSCDNLTIYSEENTVAQTYANTNNISWEKIDFGEIHGYSKSSFRNMKLGTSTDITVALFTDGVMKENQGEFTFTFSDPSVASCSNIRTTTQGTTVTLNADKIGTTMLTITDKSTGETAHTSITVTATGSNIISTDEIPLHEEFGEPYNFYINGMYITDFKKTKKDDKTDIVTMRVYNEKSVIGFVDAYDSNHNLQDTDLIEKFDGGNVTSVKDALVSYHYLVQDTFTNGLLSFKNHHYTEESEIEVEVPKGGYIKIGNNCGESEAGVLYNTADIVTFAILKAMEVAAGDSSDALQKSLEEQLVAKINDEVKDKFIKTIRVALGKQLTADNAFDSAKELLEVMFEFYIDTNIDVVEIVRSAALEVGVELGEEALEKSAGFAKIALDGMFEMAEFANFSTQFVHTYGSMTSDVYKINVINVKKTLSSSKIKLSNSQYSYNGQAKTPNVTVKYGTETLKKNIDYKVTYKNNKSIGIAAVVISGMGDYTGTATKTFNIIPSQVKSLRQSASYSTASIKMSWNKIAGVSGYEIYRAATKNGSYKLLGTVNINSYTQSGLQAASKYYYKVRAYKTVNGKKLYGAYSEAKSMITKPATPTMNLTTGSKRIKVSWTKSSGANGYEVYMSTSRNGNYTKIKSANSLQFHYTKTGLTKGKTYYFKVRAFKKTGVGVKVYSGYSSVDSMKVK